MTYYLKDGNNINVLPAETVDISQKLAAETYMLKMNNDTKEYYLQTTNSFSLPSKVYGDPTSRANRIISTFEDRKNSTGVLLAGDKGAGKTLLTKIVSNLLKKKGIPTIIVNEELFGDNFNRIITNITEPVLIIFDEFDKVYEEKNQQQLLTLLDGVINTKKLFMFTVNTGKVSDFFMNRPGRIFYKFDYTGLDKNFVHEYSLDTLKNKSHVDEILRMTEFFSMFSFDMLQALVEEVNRYDESPYKAIENLNVDLTKESTLYTIEILYDGVPISNTFYPSETRKNPMFGGDFYIDIYSNSTRTFKDDNDTPDELRIGSDNINKISKGGILSYKFDHQGKELMVILSKKEDFKFDWKMI